MVPIKSACNFLLVINSDSVRISYRFRDSERMSLENSLFPPSHCLTLRSKGTPCEAAIST